MRIRTQALALAASLAAVSSCAAPSSKSPTDVAVCQDIVSAGPAVDDIRALEEAGAAGNVTGLPVEAADQMFGPGYVSVGPDGVVRTREEILGGWKTQPWASQFNIRDLQIRIYCDMAIAVGLADAQGIGAPPGTKPTYFRWTNIWTKSGAGWRMSASQFTRFQ